MKKFLLVLVIVFSVSCGTDIDREIKHKAEEDVSQKIPSDYNPEAKLEGLDITLRDQGTPVANYVHAVRTGNLIFLAGKGPKQANGENVVGKLGSDLSVEEGYNASREAGINQLSVLKEELGDLSKVKRIVKVKGMVNAIPEFTDHSKVINGYS